VALKANKDLEYINHLFEAGNLRSVIDGPYKLEQLPEAFRHFEKAAHKGKIVITI
jgi:NADPH:quinone reductase-like Zn-dependent oxidoreductase